MVCTCAIKVRSDARWSRATEPVFRRVSESLNICGVLARMGDGLSSQRPDLASSADVVEGLHEKTILEVAVRGEDLDNKELHFTVFPRSSVNPLSLVNSLRTH